MFTGACSGSDGQVGSGIDLCGSRDATAQHAHRHLGVNLICKLWHECEAGCLLSLCGAYVVQNQHAVESTQMTSEVHSGRASNMTVAVRACTMVYRTKLA
jgi:hypothetical protein